MPRTGGAPTRASGIVSGLGGTVKGDGRWATDDGRRTMGDGRTKLPGTLSNRSSSPSPILSCGRDSFFWYSLPRPCRPWPEHSGLSRATVSIAMTRVAMRIVGTTSHVRGRCSERRRGNGPSSSVNDRGGTRSCAKRGRRPWHTTVPSAHANCPQNGPRGLGSLGSSARIASGSDERRRFASEAIEFAGRVDGQVPPLFWRVRRPRPKKSDDG